MRFYFFLFSQCSSKVVRRSHGSHDEVVSDTWLWCRHFAMVQRVVGVQISKGSANIHVISPDFGGSSRFGAFLHGLHWQPITEKLALSSQQ